MLRAVQTHQGIVVGDPGMRRGMYPIPPCRPPSERRDPSRGAGLQFFGSRSRVAEFVGHPVPYIRG